MFIYLWQTWQTCIKTKICEHAFMYILYIEREGVPTPQNYGPMGSNSMVRRDFSHVDIPVLSPVSRVKKGATWCRSMTYSKRTPAIDLYEGNIFQRWMAWWAVDANMLRQFCASQEKTTSNSTRFVRIEYCGTLTIPRCGTTLCIHQHICSQCRQAESLWLTTALGEDSGSWTDHLIWMLLAFLGAGCAIQYLILAISYPLVI